MSFIKQSRLGLRLILSLFLAFSILACASGPAIGPYVPGNGSFTLLHTNDMHGRVLAGDFDGMGMDRIAALVEGYRADGHSVLLLDAGDTLHGLPIATLDRGSSIVKIMNAIGYEAMVPGNHDFNYGYQRLLELDTEANFPFLAANVFVDATGKTLLPPYIIKEVGGVRVGIFGLATPETLYKSHPDGTRGLTFEPPIRAAARMVDLLRDKVDVLIALAHLGFEGDYDSRILAKAVIGIDIIVDGHSHTNLPEGEFVERTLIVSAQEYNKNLGVVEVVVEDGRIVDISASQITKAQAQAVAPHQPIVELVAEITEAQKRILEAKVGVAAVTLDGERATVRTRESAFVNMILDAFMAETGAELAFTNGGGIRTSIDAGDVTMAQVLAVMPFGNRIVTMRLTGAQILAALEVGAARAPDANGALLHVGGMQYTIDTSRPAGNRVNPAKVLVGGQPLDLQRSYLVATNDFLKAGGDGMTMLAPVPIVLDVKDQAEAVADYFRANSPVNPRLENRIIFGSW